MIKFAGQTRLRHHEASKQKAVMRVMAVRNPTCYPHPRINPLRLLGAVVVSCCIYFYDLHLGWLVQTKPGLLAMVMVTVPSLIKFIIYHV